MGSGSSSNVEAEQPVEVGPEDGSVDIYNDLYTNQKEEAVEDVPVDAFPSLQNMRYWQKANPTAPEFDEDMKLMPRPNLVDMTELKQKEMRVEVEEAMLTYPLETLVASLVNSCQNDKERVLTFFRWIQDVETNLPSAYDNHAAYYFARQPKEPIAILELFQKLCQLSSIPCEIIRGHAKGASYAKRLGDPMMKLSEPNHHWLAVAIDDYWHLIDLVWCVQQRTDFYFLCEAPIFVFSHLPVDEDWQLLYRPVTKKEFMELAYVHKSFYYHNLELLSHHTHLIKNYGGEEVIRLGYKEERLWSYRLTCEKAGTIVKNVAGTPLEKCVMIEAFEGKARFTVRFPSADKYRIDIMCQDPDYLATPPSLVCTYIIEVHKALPNFLDFPLLDTTLWGPTKTTLACRLTPKSHPRGRVCVEESVQITFSSPVETFLVCHLETEMENDFDLDQCVIDSYNSTTQDVSVNVLLPQTGFYKLSIYLEPEKEGGEKVFACAYLLECVRRFTQRLVFKNYGDKLGVQSMRKVLQEAINTKNLHKLRAAVAIMKANKMAQKVQEEALLAEDMLAKMERIDEMKQAIEQTDRGTISEMRNYSKPPQAVHDVLIASLLMMGDSEDTTRIWVDVQSKCGNVGPFSLGRRVRNFSILYLHPEIALRCVEILERHDIDAVQMNCPGAALFYSWALSNCNEVLDRDENRYRHKPASVKRQKEIFMMIAKGDWPNIDVIVSPEVTV